MIARTRGSCSLCALSAFGALLLLSSPRALAGEEAGVAQDPAEGPYLDLARRIESTMNRQDPSFFDAHLDLDAMIDRAARGLDLGGEFMEGFRRGAKRSAEAGSIPRQLAAEKWAFKFLRLRRVGGEPRALFRALAPSGAFNYFDLFLAGDPAGDVRVVDMSIYGAGETTSETLRWGLLQFASEVNRGVLERLMGPENEFVKSVPKLKKAFELARAHDFAGCLRTIEELPARLEREKHVLLLKINCASRIGDDESYADGIKAFQEYFPRDPAVDLIIIDRYVLDKEYERAFPTLDRLDRAVGGDAYLKVMRGRIRKLQGKLAEAKAQGQAAVAQEPTLFQAYGLLLGVSLEEKDHRETARLLDDVEAKLGMRPEALTGAPEYADFLKSKEYQRWKRSRR